ncbi:hypothetical protein MTO96_038954, partial [Rhipicephalus appendiculatus]
TQHRRLLQALEESGLIDKSVRNQFTGRDDRSHVAFDMPFTDYVLVYIVGCSLSVVVLCVEVFLASRPLQQQRRKRRQHPRMIDLWTG